VWQPPPHAAAVQEQRQALEQEQYSAACDHRDPNPPGTAQLGEETNAMLLPIHPVPPAHLLATRTEEAANEELPAIPQRPAAPTCCLQLKLQAGGRPEGPHPLQAGAAHSSSALLSANRVGAAAGGPHPVALITCPSCRRTQPTPTQLLHIHYYMLLAAASSPKGL
jgi:hypothetical protein